MVAKCRELFERFTMFFSHPLIVILYILFSLTKNV
jgi:hypothetical protein